MCVGSKWWSGPPATGPQTTSRTTTHAEAPFRTPRRAKEMPMAEGRTRQHRAEYDSSLRNADTCAERAMAIEEPAHSAALAIIALTYATMTRPPRPQLPQRQAGLGKHRRTVTPPSGQARQDRADRIAMVCGMACPPRVLGDMRSPVRGTRRWLPRSRRTPHAQLRARHFRAVDGGRRPSERTTRAGHCGMPGCSGASPDVGRRRAGAANRRRQHRRCAVVPLPAFL
jgi:hypothetical protein